MSGFVSLVSGFVSSHLDLSVGSLDLLAGCLDSSVGCGSTVIAESKDFVSLSVLKNQLKSKLRRLIKLAVCVAFAGRLSSKVTTLDKSLGIFG